MNFGVVLPTFGMSTDRETVLETALAAMELGYDSIWCSDHLALPLADAEPFGSIFEPLSTLAYLAGITRGIKLGISSLVLPQRNPVEVARQLAAIDLLSEGRTILATGIGWSQGEYTNLGYDYGNRAERMEEAVRVLKLLWSSRTPATFHGKFYHFDELVFTPLPLQFGGPKVWIAGNSEAAVQRAARLGDGWHPTLSNPQEMIKLLAKICHFLEDRDFTVCQRLSLSFGPADPEKVPLQGSPEQIIRRLRAFQGAGMDDCILYFTNESLAGRIDDMHLFITQIAPELE